MTFEYLWYSQYQVRSMPYDITFGTFSAAHLVWLAICAAVIVLFVRLYIKGDGRRRADMRRVTALFMIFSEFFKMSLMAIQGIHPEEYLPIEICSLAEYFILIDSMWPDNKALKQMLSFTFLPAAVMALLFPAAVQFPAVNIYTIRFFLFHAGIAAYVIARYAAGEIKPRYYGLWISLAVTLAVAIAVRRFDIAFGFNFMFLIDPFGNPMLSLLWNAAGGKGGAPYIAVLTAFTGFVMHIAYLVYRVIGRKRQTAPDAGAAAQELGNILN